MFAFWSYKQEKERRLSKYMNYDEVDLHLIWRNYMITEKSVC